MDVLRVGARRYAVMATTLDGAYFTAVVELGDDGRSCGGGRAATVGRCVSAHQVGTSLQRILRVPVE
jgi:hypothetical protein